MESSATDPPGNARDCSIVVAGESLVLAAGGIMLDVVRTHVAFMSIIIATPYGQSSRMVQLRLLLQQ